VARMLELPEARGFRVKVQGERPQKQHHASMPIHENSLGMAPSLP
jgi:hypothetical protein